MLRRTGECLLSCRKVVSALPYVAIQGIFFVITHGSQFIGFGCKEWQSHISCERFSLPMVPLGSAIGNKHNVMIPYANIEYATHSLLFGTPDSAAALAYPACLFAVLLPGNQWCK